MGFVTRTLHSVHAPWREPADGLLVVAFAVGRIALLELGLHRVAPSAATPVALPELAAGTTAAA